MLESPGAYIRAVLSLLMGVASMATGLCLPGMPGMSRSLNAGAGMIEWTIKVINA